MMTPFPYRPEFQRHSQPTAPAAICLNHAGTSPIPGRTAQKLSQLAEYLTRRGSFRYKVLEETLEEARRRCAHLLQVSTEQVAWVRNTSEGVSLIALGLDWRAGDEIVTTDQEFPSNSVVWLDIARRFGVTVHQVPSMTDGTVVVEALLARVTPRTRVVTVSSKRYINGSIPCLQPSSRRCWHAVACCTPHYGPMVCPDPASSTSPIPRWQTTPCTWP